jgi:transposase
MIRPGAELRVYLCREAVDMRKYIDGLSVLVQEAMALNPFEQAVFVFGNRQRDKVKILFSERNGLCSGTSAWSRSTAITRTPIQRSARPES